MNVRALCCRAKEASRRLAAAPTAARNDLLVKTAAALAADREAILAANRRDRERAEAERRPAAFRDRLALDEKRLAALAEATREVALLPDPVGEVLETVKRPNGLLIEKVRVPIGVIGIIYEARPTVTVEAAGLCLKAGNAVVLRGGSGAGETNRALARALAAGLAGAGLPPEAAALVDTPDRAAVGELLRASDCVDLIIPRGGEELIRRVAAESRIPVIKHYQGICHTYVDEGADPELAERICLNAKVQRPGVCNAMETLLIHRAAAAPLLPRLAAALAAAGVELRGDAEARRLVPAMKEATEADWSTEYLDLILSVRVVGSLEEAMAHIARYGSAHSDAIVTADRERAERFLNEVDSAAVFLNCSTRFNDGGQFGLGAEIGISTDRLHARGPMGLKELTIYKYVVRGEGQVRA